MNNHFNEVPYDLLVNLANEVERTIGATNDRSIVQLATTLTNRREFRRRLYKIDELFIRDDALQLANVPEAVGNRKIVKLQDDLFFGALVGNQRVGTILLTNNDFARALSLDHSLLQRAPLNFLIGWDIDSHHWISNSIRFATYVDCYFPAQFTNLDLYQRLFGDTTVQVPLGSVQWSMEQLLSFSDCLSKPRQSNLPFGIHGFYQQFYQRNAIVSQWNTVSPHCLLSNNLTSYSSLSPSERLGFWTGTTTHLVVPVNGDLPFRFFDGLITLSCLLMPFNLKHQVDMLNLDEGEKNLIVYFRPSTLTIDEMNRLIEMCRNQWEQVIAGGADEITKDIEARVKNHHVSNRIERVIREVDELMHEDPQ